MRLGKYSFGIGDRFGRQGRAQLAAVVKAKAAGLDITPVWNKSHREHTIIGTQPGDVRQEADAAVAYRVVFGGPIAHDHPGGNALAAEHQHQGTGEILAVARAVIRHEILDGIKILRALDPQLAQRIDI